MYYENVFCHICGQQVCQECGCCENENCKSCSCPEGLYIKSLAEENEKDRSSNGDIIKS